MSKHYSKKRRLKYVFVALALTASLSVTGLASACNTSEPTEDEKTTSVEDTQLLKNGNFEFFTVPEQKEGENAPEYLINTPNNWTRGGTTSYTMSGIIGTSDTAWGKLTAEDLAEKLDANNALDSSASDYKDKHIDYNGMKSSDLLYKDTYGALKYDTITSGTEDDKTKYYIDEGDNKVEIFYNEDNETYYYDSELTRPVKQDMISNPGAHNIFKDENGKPYYVDENNEKQTVYEDENGDYYLEYDEDKDEYSQPVGHVLMLHNYSSSTHNGIAQNYASVEVSLPANTSAEVSVWVKTSDLLFSQGKYVNDDQDHGANITITHTAGSSTLDDFSITSINTEKLIAKEKYSDEYNGWVEYTVYINACNFASSNITIKLGLGETNAPVEGYAFFDDITVTQYADLSDEDCSYSQNEAKIYADNAYCTLTSDASEKIFVADTYERNGGSDNTANGVYENRFSENFHYLLDLASESEYNAVTFAGAKAEITADDDNYVSTKDTSVKTYGFINGLEQLGTAKLPEELKNLTGGNGLDASGDFLALVNAGYEFNSNHTKYYERLNEALSSATSLPNASETDNKMLVLFSAKGAGYTASFDLTIEEEGYQIISFWVKTSDMGGNTAATIKVTEDGNKDNSANITVDSTGIVTDIDDEHEDIYNGWVQCFFFVHNDTKKVENETSPATLHIEFSFGNTTINGNSVVSYKAGWAALANMQTLVVDEDVFAYTGSGSYTSSLTISEEDSKTTNVFDEVYGNQMHEIENGIVDPNSYFGTNGGSSKVVNNGVISPFDDKNPNENAGLINRDHIENYKDAEWYKTLLGNFGIDTTSPNYSTTDALVNWNEVFGSKSYQPLIIINSLRSDYVQEKTPTEDNFANYYYYDDEKDDYVKVDPDNDTFDKDTKYYTLKDVLNYGFVGNEQTVSSDGFTTVSVRVKVSAGAVAYIYLVDTSDSASILEFKAPSYSFWYDEDGNVLKAETDEDATFEEQRANVLYKPRTDGLFEDANGKLFANTWNYSKLYNANVTYYTKDGEFSVDELVDGVTYYKDSNCTTEADHFLVTTSGTKVYEFKNGNYYYIVSGETQKDVITPFDISYARYDYSGLAEEYMAVVEDTHGEWVTVNFVIHAGSESKTYRLELWSGERDKQFTDGNTENGSVIFDYSYTSISSDDLMNEYENEIVKAYQKILADNDLLSGISTSTENIEYYRNLVEENIKAGNLSQSEVDKYEILKNYTAHYYTFSLYDSADYQPFNADVADENSTGYVYSINDYEESLAYLAVKDGNVYTVFADYSTIDQSISLDTDDEEEDEEETEDSNDVNVWLLASSIVLVIALLFAMIAILVKDTLKKTRRNKVLGKNNYNRNRTNRYIRKLGIKKEEYEEVEAPAETPDETEDSISEQVEQTEEQNVETAEPEQTEETNENSDGSENQ